MDERRKEIKSEIAKLLTRKKELEKQLGQVDELIDLKKKELMAVWTEKTTNDLEGSKKL